MSSYTVKPLSVSDYDALWSLFLVVFPLKYKNEFLDAWLARNPQLSLGAFSDDGRLIAFLVTTQKAMGLIQIEFLGVSPTLQKSGVGTDLLQRVLTHCVATQQQATLVPVPDDRVIRWYQKHGFRAHGAPRVSPYTGEVEQAMRFSSSSSASTPL